MIIPAKRKPKYSNRRIVVDGETFDSKAEYSRWLALQTLQRVGLIRDLTRQASFVLAPKVVIQGKVKRSLIYRADFQYFDVKAGQVVVEDKKGALTQVFIIKRHLMKAIHNIDIVET